MMTIGTLIGLMLLVFLLGCVGLYFGLRKSPRYAYRMNTVTWNQSMIWQYESRKMVRLSSLAAVILLLAMAIGPAAAPLMAKVTHAQPELMQMAAQRPGQIVSVIIQKMGAAAGLEAQVERLGGKVLADLGIINAFAAEMTAGAARELATHSSVRWVSLDAKVEPTACSQCIDTANLLNAYDSAVRAKELWNVAPYLQGQGIGVAVLDSGVSPNSDFYTTAGVNRQVANVRFNSDYNQTAISDGYGHGTHVASIVGGNGSASGGKYIGVAPMVKIINVKVSNDNGSASTQNVVQGLQWVLQNKTAYNIRVVNLSLNSALAESYHTSPLDAAVEVLWFNGIVVVVSAGNNGSAMLYPPANDPFVITVGAADDKGTNSISDDAMASFSAYGTTESGFAKPDLVAPGKNITARLITTNSNLVVAHPANLVNNQYFRMSGTSMAAPVVSGVVALLLQDEPGLTPDQVKYRLMATANKSWVGNSAAKAGAGYVDAYAAVLGASTQNANTGITASQLLWTGSTPITWGSVAWNSVAWNSVAWNSVAWNSVAWNSVAWNSDYWGN
jgi:serine protease AprX